MLFLWWAIIAFLFVMSLIGVFVPFMPDTLPLWLGFLLYQFTLADTILPVSFWVGMLIISALIIGSDYYTNAYFVKKYGGSKWSILGAIFGVIFGALLFGPPGIIAGPLLAVFLITFLESRETAIAYKAALGTIFALVSSAVIKIILQLMMLSWFFLSR